MNENFKTFINTFESANTAKVVKSLSKLGEFDYTNFTPVDLEQVVLRMNPNSQKDITTILYVLSLYAKYIGDKNLETIVHDADRSAIWLMAKPNANKKFISNTLFNTVYHDIGVYEEYNSFYYQTLFKCLYEGIYNDDLSVIKNLKSSDIKGNIVTLREDNGHSYELTISDSLSNDLCNLGEINVWERRNRYGTCRINIIGLYSDSCFKVENRRGSSAYSYRFTYYRMLRKISKDYVGYNLLPLQLYVSGIMYRIKLELDSHGITLEDAFSDNNKNRIVRNVISKELARCNNDTEVRNFREMVKGHVEIFCH